MSSVVLQNEDGQVMGTHSISAGLDYAAIGPQHAYLKDIGRAEYLRCSDKEALAGFHLLSEAEGIIPALETAHAFGVLDKICEKMKPGSTIVVNVSGRGDKDLNEVARLEGIDVGDK